MAGPRWTDEEVTILEVFYPNTKEEELVEMLPGRSFKAIQVKAFFLKIRRDKEFVNDLRQQSRSKLTYKQYLENHKKYVPMLKEHYQYMMKLFYGY